MKLLDAFYESRFENEFLRAKGEAFQDFFEQLMSRAYQADFMACRPWGRDGDRKNDGYLQSQRRLFQVYAPNEMIAAKAKAKICEDFEGAQKHWRAYFDTWVFVHNADGGLPPQILQLLLDLDQANPDIKIESWTLEELRAIFRKLSDDDKASWFGPAPTENTRNHLGFKDLRIVLQSIATKPPPQMAEVKDVPAGKIEANALSEAITSLLKESMTKSSLVEEFFCQWHDATLGEQLAAAFQAEYQRLRKTIHDPNRIFAELQSWAGGDQRGSPEHEIAVLTVIVYYFERCDIFEEPQKNRQ